MFTFPVGFFNLIASGDGGGTTDPFAANVVLFLKGDGTNGSTNIIDSSPTPKTISVFGNAQISTAQSKYGGSSLFATNTTVGSFVQAATTINLSANYTFEAWIYQTAAQDCTLLAGENIGGVDFAITGSQIRIGRSNVAWDVIVNVTFTYNTFQHIAFSRSGGTQKIFLNGVEVFSGNYGMGLTATNPRVMCTRDNFANQFARQLNGYIDSVRFTDSVARYTTNFNPETDTYLDIPTPTPTDPYANNVVLFLKGDGTNGSTNIVDSSPSPKTISVFGNTQISTAQSKYGGSSLLFDGNGDYLSIPATGDMLFSSQNFTWEAWIYPTTLSAPYRITLMGNARANAGGDFGMHLQVKKNATNQTMFSAWGNENGSIGSSLNLNQWNHIACTRVGTTVEIFVNGIKGTTGSCATSITSHTAFLIGTVFNNSGFASDYTGYIDSLRLTAAVRYTANFNPETDTYLNV